MNQPNRPVTVRVMEKDYRIVCPPDEQGMLLRTAEYLNDEMATIRRDSKVLSTERIAVLAALNITRQLLEGRELELPDDLGDGELAGRIDRVLDAIEPGQA
ncbi:MAG: cell division protein ZapA [Halothiobacillaceae bacterium]|nr:cell division protein ZapA [Halothiobacillaceae bacterium]HER35370.1 cell division protein ZapA [Halothiobacillaceae bacterium]